MAVSPPDFDTSFSSYSSEALATMSSYAMSCSGPAAEKRVREEDVIADHGERAGAALRR